jgi:uncharacterized protein (TIGR02391 family)
MDPRERLAIIEGLCFFSGSRLESFFRAHGLGAAYRKSGSGAGKEQKINDALSAAERRGDADEILTEAVRHFSLDADSHREPAKVSAPDKRVATPFEVRRVQRLHPLVQEAAADLLRDGHPGAAILEAYKAIELRVKELAEDGDRSGRDLMAHAFRLTSPAVALNRGESRSDRDEQEGFQHIFMGAMQGIRNPKAHDPFVPVDADRAFEYLALASLLMRRLDDAEHT